MQSSSRRPALAALPIFKIHLAFAIATLAGIAWQLTSRAVPTLRPLHHLTGPYVALVWCVALLTGTFNYVFLSLMRPPGEEQCCAFDLSQRCTASTASRRP